MNLTHIDESGKARMVDVGGKPVTDRIAVAEGYVILPPEAANILKDGNPKGSTLDAARLAGIMAAKRTSELIPLCHQIPLSNVAIDFETPDPARIHIIATASATARTGVEMEALTAVSVAALTIYDMLKAASKGIRIEGIRLLSKSGGKSGAWEAKNE